jgi:beta-barrel assembly-enhancing protease
VREKPDEVNAFTDGRRIVVTPGMMRFVDSDGELALVISHELAHAAMHHTAKQQANAVVGGIAGAVVGALIAELTGVNVIQSTSNVGADLGRATFSQGFEAEADYVGTYYAARAGYNASEAANFWRRWASMHPDAIGTGGAHPATAERFVAIEETAAEIARKKSGDMALVPNRR